jgi:NAD+ synthase (glutamine-hydrolysing)
VFATFPFSKITKRKKTMKNPTFLRIALVQLNFTVGDLNRTCEKILESIKKCEKFECDLIAFPELSTTGYPPEDLVLRKKFIIDQKRMLDKIAAAKTVIPCVIGMVDEQNERLYNSAAILQNGFIHFIYHKIHLPNYSVFDEERYFDAGTIPFIMKLNDIKVGLSICEDIWIDNSVVETQVFFGGAEVLLNISASPFYQGKHKERIRLLRSRAQMTCSCLAYVNLTGGQDELVFDGRSLIMNEQGDILAGAKAFEEDVLVCDIDVATVRSSRANSTEFIKNSTNFKNPFDKIMTIVLSSQQSSDRTKITSSTAPELTAEAEVYHALIMGLQDYVLKNGFTKVTLGLSGGIDSALVATLAVDALGKDNVIGVAMPSKYSSSASLADAQQLSHNLGIQLLVFSIQDIFIHYLQLFDETFKNMPSDITEENLQARIRGNILMALSNKFGWMVLTTGNKSEISVGYSTLYGDSAGGFAPLKDVLKTMVYRLCNYRNTLAGYDLVPQAIFVKPPSAELRPNQTDQDTLPPYDQLDGILELYVEEQNSQQEIAAKGYEPRMVQEVIRMVDISEYKRRQAAPGIKITPRAFGKDRRMPITNRYREL